MWNQTAINTPPPSPQMELKRFGVLIISDGKVSNIYIMCGGYKKKKKKTRRVFSPKSTASVVGFFFRHPKKLPLQAMMTNWPTQSRVNCNGVCVAPLSSVFTVRHYPFFPSFSITV